MGKRKRTKWGQGIKSALDRLGKTQDQLADALNYSKSRVSEALYSNPTAELRNAIAHVVRQWEDQEKTRKEQEREERKWR